MKDRFHIVCPHCRSLNRVPPGRLRDRPQCGHCHGPIFTGRPLALTRANFDLYATHSDIPLVVDFWASWCGPCHVMAPNFEEAAKLLEPHVRLGKVDSEEERGLAETFQIASIPTLILFLNGCEQARQSGVRETRDIVRWVRSWAEVS